MACDAVGGTFVTRQAPGPIEKPCLDQPTKESGKGLQVNQQGTNRAIIGTQDSKEAPEAARRPQAVSRAMGLKAKDPALFLGREPRNLEAQENYHQMETSKNHCIFP